MKQQWYQRTFKWTSWLIVGFFFLGSLLDTISISVDTISPSITYIGTVVILLSVVAIMFITKFWSLTWVTDDGQVVRIKVLGLQSIFIIAGIIFALWIPRISNFINPVPPDLVNMPPCHRPDELQLIPLERINQVVQRETTDLNSDGQEEIVLLVTERQDYLDQPYLDVISCDKSTLTWKNIYHDKTQFPFVQRFRIVSITNGRKHQIILDGNTGVCGCLFLTVVGFDEKLRSQILLQPDASDFFKSRYIVEGKSIMIVNSWEPSTWTAYYWDGNKFVKGNPGFTPAKSSVIINFWQEGDTIMVDTDSVTIFEGQAVYFRRDLKKGERLSDIVVDLGGDTIGERSIKREYGAYSFTPTVSGKYLVHLHENRCPYGVGCYTGQIPSTIVTVTVP